MRKTGCSAEAGRPEIRCERKKRRPDLSGRLFADGLFGFFHIPANFHRRPLDNIFHGSHKLFRRHAVFVQKPSLYRADDAVGEKVHAEARNGFTSDDRLDPHTEQRMQKFPKVLGERILPLDPQRPAESGAMRNHSAAKIFSGNRMTENRRYEC